MLEFLGEIVGNAHFEAYIGGPLAGLIIALIFNGFTANPQDKAKKKLSPKEATRRIKAPDSNSSTLNSTKEIHHHHYHHKKTGQDDDGSGLLIISVFVLIIGSFFFVAYFPELIWTFGFFITSIASFSLTLLLLAAIKGQFNTMEWWFCSAFPLAASLVCLWVTWLVYGLIKPELTIHARLLMDSQPFSIPNVINGSISFFKERNSDFYDITSGMCALALVLISAITSMLQITHYIALANSRNGSSIWTGVVEATGRYKGGKTAIITVFLLTLSWLLASGTISHIWPRPSLQ